MKVTQYIKDQIQKMPRGSVFSYSYFMQQPGQQEAIIKALNRMASAGKLAKLAKGKFYKVEETVFGQLEPDQYQTVKDLLQSNGKVTGYLTGYSIYNKLGLTTQVSNTIQIGKNDIRYSVKRGKYSISFIRQKNEILDNNIPLLQILDAIRYMKKIPDASLAVSYERLSILVSKQTEADKIRMVNLLFKYPASTRVLAGTMFEKAGAPELAKKLRQTLNPVTAYKMPGINKLIANADNWNIK